MLKQPDKQKLASAVQFLLDGKQHNEASVLLSCTIEYGPPQEYIGSGPVGVNITLRCHRTILESFQGEEVDVFTMPTPLFLSIQAAIEACLPTHLKIHDISVRSHFVEITPDWKVIERFDATECFNGPDKVVQKFLYILNNA